MPPKSPERVWKTLVAHGGSNGTMRRSSVLRAVFNVIRAAAAPLGTLPILSEDRGCNNRSRPVIHRRGTRESCVFHSIHNFAANLAGGRGRTQRSGNVRTPVRVTLADPRRRAFRLTLLKGRRYNH